MGKNVSKDLMQIVWGSFAQWVTRTLAYPWMDSVLGRLRVRRVGPCGHVRTVAWAGYCPPSRGHLHLSPNPTSLEKAKCPVTCQI